MVDSSLSTLLSYMPFVVHFCLAVAIHEFAHALVASRRGDSTAKDQGRLTLNPFAHLDPMGTLFLLFAGVGWGRPVPINPSRLPNPKQDQLWISLAGPLSNILLATVWGIILWSLASVDLSVWLGESAPLVVSWALGTGILLNIALALFNLLPIFPLDGEKVVVGLLPDRWERRVVQFRNYGVIVLILFLVGGPALGFSPFGWFADHVIDPFFRFLMPGGFEVYW